MTKHTFKMSDVTGDTRLLARSALGYDFNYYADDETIIFGTDSDATIAWDGDSLEVTSADTNFSAGVTLTTGDLTVTAGDAHVVAGSKDVFADDSSLRSLIHGLLHSLCRQLGLSIDVDIYGVNARGVGCYERALDDSVWHALH